MILESRARDRIFKVVFPYLLGIIVMGLYFMGLEQIRVKPEWELPAEPLQSRAVVENEHVRDLAAQMANFEDDRQRDFFYKGLSDYDRRLLFRYDIDVRAGRQLPVGAEVPPQPETAP